MLVVICYDIADDRRRNRVAKALEGYGARVQESVFECHLDPGRLRQLQARLESGIDPREDRLRFYSLCSKDRLLVISHGTGGPPQDETDIVI